MKRQLFFSLIRYLTFSITVAAIFLYVIGPRWEHHKQVSASHSSTPDSITHHTLTLQGKKYAYTTRAGTLTLYDTQHHPTAKVFYTADTLDNFSSKKRPITFFYNGGPGSSSMLLRMASFGPKRIILNNHKAVSPAPYRLVDNKYSLLDKTDLVFIDMPGTGFGRLIGNSKPSDFYSVDKDAAAFTHFIKHYVNVNHRWNSPKFLFGESYGTTRTAILAHELQNQGIQLNGVILLSSILNYGLMGNKAGIGDWQYILYLPSMAAASWYFHQSDYHPSSLTSLLAEVEHFALTDYITALAQGSQLSTETFHAIAQKLHRYLGLSQKYIENNNLRISSGKFSATLIREKQEKMGRFDARFTLFSVKNDDNSSKISPDSTMVTIKDAVLAMSNEYLHKDLHYQSSIPYLSGLSIYKKWNFRHGDQWLVNSSFDLINAMIDNPYLRVFSASGYYDFATPYLATVYTFQHMNLPPALNKNITQKFYASGHMIYLDPGSLKQLRQDLGEWYDNTDV